MKPRPQSVPFGYEPPKEIKKGTLFFLRYIRGDGEAGAGTGFASCQSPRIR